MRFLAETAGRQPSRKAIGCLHIHVSRAQDRVQGCCIVLAFAKPCSTETEHCMHASSKMEQARVVTGIAGCMVRKLYYVVMHGIHEHHTDMLNFCRL